MYATVTDVRAEGIAAPADADARIESALQEATDIIDRACGWYFEPRKDALLLSGRGGPFLDLPLPIIKLEALRLGSDQCDTTQFTIIGPSQPHFYLPKLIRPSGSFARGTSNVWVSGVWGYTVECAANGEGCTPLPIRRAALLLAARLLPKLGEGNTQLIRSPWRLTQERTRDQSYQMQPVAAGTLTGDPEIDDILIPFRRPMCLGAA